MLKLNKFPIATDASVCAHALLRPKVDLWMTAAKKLPQGFQDMKRPCSDLLLCRQAFAGAAPPPPPPSVRFSKPVRESATR